MKIKQSNHSLPKSKRISFLNNNMKTLTNSSHNFKQNNVQNNNPYYTIYNPSSSRLSKSRFLSNHRKSKNIILSKPNTDSFYPKINTSTNSKSTTKKYKLKIPELQLPEHSFGKYISNETSIYPSIDSTLPNNSKYNTLEIKKCQTFKNTSRNGEDITNIFENDNSDNNDFHTIRPAKTNPRCILALNKKSQKIFLKQKLNDLNENTIELDKKLLLLIEENEIKKDNSSLLQFEQDMNAMFNTHQKALSSHNHHYEKKTTISHNQLGINGHIQHSQTENISDRFKNISAMNRIDKMLLDSEEPITKRKNEFPYENTEEDKDELTTQAERLYGDYKKMKQLRKKFYNDTMRMVNYSKLISQRALKLNKKYDEVNKHVIISKPKSRSQLKKDHKIIKSLYINK